MPIYEYECTNCHNKFENFQTRINIEVDVNCPKCEKKAKRIISQSSFSLKGGGWYKDGYTSQKASASSATNNSTSSASPAKKTGS